MSGSSGAGSGVGVGMKSSSSCGGSSSAGGSTGSGVGVVGKPHVPGCPTQDNQLIILSVSVLLSTTCISCIAVLRLQLGDQV